MPKVYKTKFFNKWQRKSSELSDADLILAIDEMLKGLFEANLGGNLYKKRISKTGFGKRSSYRIIIATKLENRWVFVFGFAKNKQNNISSDELKAVQRYATLLLDYTDDEFEIAIRDNHIMEINCENE